VTDCYKIDFRRWTISATGSSAAVLQHVLDAIRMVYDAACAQLVR